MMQLEARKAAIMALKKKLAKLMLEDGIGEEQGMSGDLMTEERGANNMEEEARELGEVESATNGEDGEKEVSIEIEAEGSGEGMEELYKRMREEFGAPSLAREAAGKKKALFGGMGRGQQMKAQKRRG